MSLLQIKAASMDPRPFMNLKAAPHLLKKRKSASQNYVSLKPDPRLCQTAKVWASFLMSLNCVSINKSEPRPHQQAETRASFLRNLKLRLHYK